MYDLYVSVRTVNENRSKTDLVQSTSIAIPEQKSGKLSQL